MTPQSSIAHYRIVSKIGEGGMGAVYRATDTKLGREVAIKVLPDALANDPDYLARFAREAQVLASLNHPNIAILHGIEERALVMELVEGATLEERVAAGPVPVDEALAIARQIADALEAAHEKGVVHRDLKPGNIKIKPDGTVKVLDFGLAKTAEPAGSAANATISPTLTIRATQAGVILGTAGYMSPEQAAGKPVDRRADIWSFGVVLWEMLTGRRLFNGETVSHTLADVLRGPIDFAALPAETPAAVRALLRRCLDRNVRNRLRDIGEARVALDPGLQPAPEAPAAAVPSRGSRKLPWIAAGGALAAAAALGFLYWRAAQPALVPMQRFDVPFTAPERLRPFLALSPDGTRFACIVRGPDSIQRIYLRRLDQADGVLLPGTDGATSPFFSPDGQWVAFAADGSLKKIPAQGGAPIKLCAATDLRGGSWGDDGNIVFTPDNRSPLYRVPDSGGNPQRLTELQSGEISHRSPQVLPGSRSVLFSANSSPANFEDSNIQWLDLPSGRITKLHQGGFGARYLPGYLLWAHEGALFGAAFDSGRLRMQTPVPLVEKLADDPGSGLGNFEISSAGTYVGMTGVAHSGLVRTLLWLDRNGKPHPLKLEPKDYGSESFSPDGKRLALEIRDSGKFEIFLYDPDAERLSQLTFTGQASEPVWTPDGKYLVFRRRAEPSGLYRIRADGSGAPEALYTGPDLPGDAYPSSFSADGRTLIVVTSGISSKMWKLPLVLSDRDHVKAGKPELLYRSGETDGAISPDGKWLAYSRSDSNRFAVFVEPFPATGGKWRIGDGRLPEWSRSGRELFYVDASLPHQIMAVPYRADGSSFVADKPRPWAEAVSALGNWGMSPDGNHAVVPVPLDAKPSDTHLTFILHFQDELERRIPAGKR
jgi:serine/threonine-protein kinase